MSGKISYEQTVVGIASIINNAIVMLWQQGQIEAASADIDFIAITKGPRAELAKQAKTLIVRIKSDNPMLQSNFPPQMTFELPVGGIQQLFADVAEARENVLEELATIQHRFDVANEVDNDEPVFSTRQSDLPSLGPDHVIDVDDEPRQSRDTGLPPLGPDQ